MLDGDVAPVEVLKRLVPLADFAVFSDAGLLAYTGLGDVPLLGWLFKSEGRSRKKSNLMVFLRPVVVRDAAASDALSNSRYLQMMGLQQNAQPNNSNPLINVGGAPVLPPLPGAVAPAASPVPTGSAGTAPVPPATEPR